MSAWSTGPFDSDGALDFLGGLADRHARTNDDSEIVPGSVDHAAVLTQLTAALTAITRPAGPPEQEYRPETIDNAYAAAGLVVAVKAGQTADVPSGTRLFGGSDAADPLGLANHCGYVALLRSEDVDQLRPAAVAAVAAIKQENDWLNTWSGSRDEVLDQLDRLQLALS